MKKILLLTFIIYHSSFIIKCNAQDLKLWYNKPAEKWTDALPLGNGRIGSMVFGGVANDRIQFNEETLWTGEPREYNKKGAYKFLEPIRKLLAQGKQKEAEALAEKEFMGLKSNDGKKDDWIIKVTNDAGFANEYFNDKNWQIANMPSYDGWEKQGLQDVDGAIWWRKKFIIENYDAEAEYFIDLNKVSNIDYTYINGKLIGSLDNDNARQYPIPKAALHSGENTVAILVLNLKDKGGLLGYKDTTKQIGIFVKGNENKIVSLKGQWKYLIVNDNPPPVGTYQASYQPFGNINLAFKNAETFEAYKRTLNLEDAIITTTYTANKINFKREYFISQPHQVMVVKLSASQKNKINVAITFNSPHKNYKVTKISDSTIALQVQVKNGALFGESYLHFKNKDGTVTINEGKLIVENATVVELYVTAATNFVTYKEVGQQVNQNHLYAYKKLKNISFDKIKKTHIKEYQKYFNTYKINFGINENIKLPTNERLEKFSNAKDPAFVALYQQYCRYLLIAASRPGTKPANLQGIWNESLNPPWGSKYTTNINAEMNYWPAEVLNLSPMHQPLFDMITELAEAGKETAKEYYNAQGFVVHHNTDIWRGTAPINAANHGIWPTGGAWLCQHLWEHYLFTQDVSFLKNTAYPLMKEAALFFNKNLIKDNTTGFLISTPSNSPEQGGLVAGPTMDHQIIRTLFNNIIDASKILNIDKIFAEGLKQKVKQIALNQIGKYGQLQEWLQDNDDTTNKHRHISHLWEVYPGAGFSDYGNGPQLMDAARKSLLFRGDEATGWSLAWKMNCWARFNDAEHSYNMLQLLLSPVKGGAGSYTNLFDAHPPFQIDGNFGAAAAIAEMLVQSHMHFIHILPALPKALQNGYVKGLLARGGFELEMKWENSKVTYLKIFSKTAKPIEMKYKGSYHSIKLIANKFNVINVTKWK